MSYKTERIDEKATFNAELFSTVQKRANAAPPCEKECYLDLNGLHGVLYAPDGKQLQSVRRSMGNQIDAYMDCKNWSTLHGYTITKVLTDGTDRFPTTGSTKVGKSIV